MSCSHQQNDLHPAFTLSYSGAMRNVMHKNELFGTIALDTISNKSHLYGVGPLEYLKGEITIVDGVPYVSNVITDSTMEVKEEHGIKAPFFVYANVPSWKEMPLPDSVVTLKQLENYLNTSVTNLPRPFPFLLIGKIQSATIHVQNLPAGTVVQSPDDARIGQIIYTIPALASVQLIGFFSTEHQGVFTHHDSFVHVHLITDDKTMMGHVETLELPAKANGGNSQIHLMLPESK